eukprot:TRINITY_DN1354_c0_g1_i2.p1 TRINITY_DN1354_c0_g1~~TRINITY_DN1354_c0_g1_i2.p1  ORF type:complete len:258 (+),score=29.22 TRINITY_DN1354_c0_g1_i2:390-1163(+)
MQGWQSDQPPQLNTPFAIQTAGPDTPVTSHTPGLARLDTPFATQTAGFAQRQLEPAPQLQQKTIHAHAPGGNATISFGDNSEGFAQREVEPAPAMVPVTRAKAQDHHSFDAPFAIQTAGPDTPVTSHTPGLARLDTPFATQTAGFAQRQLEPAPQLQQKTIHAHAPGGNATISIGDNSEGFAQREVEPAPVMAQVHRVTAKQYHSSDAPFANHQGPKLGRTANRNTGGLQNQGNTIGDVPSVKLHAPPGGTSSISFG